MAEVSKEDVASMLAKLVGSTVIHFAILEHWIDGIVFCLYARVEGAKAIRARHPFNAKAETEFMTACFEGLPVLQPFKDDAINLLNKIAPASEFRHQIVHGHIRSMNWQEGWLEFTRVVKGDAHQPVRESLTIDLMELFQKNQEIQALVPLARDLTHRLIAAFDWEYKGEKPPGGT